MNICNETRGSRYLMTMRLMNIRRTLFIVVAAVALIYGCEDDATDGDGTGPGETMMDVSQEDAQMDVIEDTVPQDVADDATTDGGERDTTPSDTPSDLEDTASRDSAADTVSDTSSSDGGGQNWRHCTGSSDCTLTKNNCCGWCGTATLADLDAVHRDRTDAHFKDVCPNPSGVVCPLCAQGPIPDSFEAHCAANTCEKIDLEPYQQCTRDSECRIRTLDCCENCQADVSTEALVAIHADDADQVRQALCPTANPVCADCPIQYPPGVTATCNNDGRCVVN